MRRVTLAAAAFAAALVAVLLAGAAWSLAVSVAWDAAAILYLGSVWWGVLGMDAAATKRTARLEDSSRAAADTILVGASAISLVSVGFVLVDAANRHGTAKGVFIGLAVASVLLAWLSIHTVFALRYASLYYSEPVGGIDYHSDDPPDYRDFAYVALTIGMTFQVSDTDLTATSIRRAAVRHSLLSYLFGAVIVAITINIVGSLVK